MNGRAGPRLPAFAAHRNDERRIGNIDHQAEWKGTFGGGDRFTPGDDDFDVETSLAVENLDDMTIAGPARSKCTWSCLSRRLRKS
jgi:hypothetical protein